MSDLTRFFADQKMNTGEIAELTQHRHDTVIKSAKRLAARMGWTLPQMAVKTRGRSRKELSLNKVQTFALVSMLKPDFLVAVVKRWQELEEECLGTLPEAKALIRQLVQRIKDIEPSAEYCDEVLSTKNGIPITAIAEELGISGITLNQLLEEWGVQRKVGDRWVLKVAYLGLELTTVVTTLDDGHVSCHHMKWTEKGRVFIHAFFSLRCYDQLESSRQATLFH